MTNQKEDPALFRNTMIRVTIGGLSAVEIVTALKLQELALDANGSIRIFVFSAIANTIGLGLLYGIAKDGQSDK